MACLRPGGVAVHTTEFTLTSESVGHDSPDLSFYCREDILALAQRLTELGHLIVLNFQRGTTPPDMHVDVAPFHYGRSARAPTVSRGHFDRARHTEERPCTVIVPACRTSPQYLEWPIASWQLREHD